MVQRADEMLRLGDISAARRLYERAATAGNGQAALALGRTHDPAFLATIPARGIQGDRAMAVTWYRRALALGADEAREPLARIGPLPGE
jgi:TPR repeat protein